MTYEMIKNLLLSESQIATWKNFATECIGRHADGTDRQVGQLKISEWLLLRLCNLSNIGGRVYVRVRVRISVRVIFSIT